MNSAVAAVQVFPTKTLRIGYAYDFSIGPLQGFSAGSHEISLGFTPNKNYNNPFDFIISGYAFGYNLNGVLAMEVIVRPLADQLMPEGAIIKALTDFQAIPSLKIQSH